MREIMDKVSAWHIRKAYAKVLSEILGNPDATRRLGRALEILMQDERYSITKCEGENKNKFIFHSPNDNYVTSLRECSCPDSEKLCKHRLALRVLKDAYLLKAQDKEMNNE